MMGRFNLDTDFCKQCGFDGSLCDGCVKKKCYQQGIADERPKAFAKGYDSGYQKGKEDALDHCDRCETDQWDALYKSEMKGRADAIREVEQAMYHQCFECDNDDMQKWDSGNWFRYKLFENVMEKLKEQKNE